MDDSLYCPACDHFTLPNGVYSNSHYTSGHHYNIAQVPIVDCKRTNKILHIAQMFWLLIGTQLSFTWTYHRITSIGICRVYAFVHSEREICDVWYKPVISFCWTDQVLNWPSKNTPLNSEWKWSEGKHEINMYHYVYDKQQQQQQNASINTTDCCIQLGADNPEEFRMCKMCRSCMFLQHFTLQTEMRWWSDVCCRLWSILLWVTYQVRNKYHINTQPRA